MRDRGGWPVLRDLLTAHSPCNRPNHPSMQATDGAAINLHAGSTFSKNFLHQIGTAGSTLLPNLVTMEAANTVVNEYLRPVTVQVEGDTQGVFDRQLSPRARPCHCQADADDHHAFD